MSDKQETAFAPSPTFAAPARSGSSMHARITELEDKILDLEYDKANLTNKGVMIYNALTGVREERDALKAIIESGSAEEHLTILMLCAKDIKDTIEKPIPPAATFTLRMDVADAINNLFVKAGLVS